MSARLSLQAPRGRLTWRQPRGSDLVSGPGSKGPERDRGRSWLLFPKAGWTSLTTTTARPGWAPNAIELHPVLNLACLSP